MRLLDLWIQNNRKIPFYILNQRTLELHKITKVNINISKKFSVDYADFRFCSDWHLNTGLMCNEDCNSYANFEIKNGKHLNIFFNDSDLIKILYG